MLEKHRNTFRIAFIGLALGFFIVCWSTSRTSANVIPAHEGGLSSVLTAPTDVALSSSDDEDVLGRLATINAVSPHLVYSQQAQGDKPIEQTRKNIQILRGLPESQLFAVMNFMRASLGVSCAFCHVNSGGDNWEWEKDDKPEKRTARRMIQLVLDTNKNFFEGRHRVTCNSCHRGSTRVMSTPLLPQTPPEGGPAGEPPKPPALPTVDQVIEKYVQAIGGKAAFEKAKTRSMKGAQISWNGASTPIEIVQQAPDRFLLTATTPQGAIMRGYNGTTGWMKGPRGQRELVGSDLAQLKRSADFFWELKIRDLARAMEVTAKQMIGDREVYVVVARTSPERTERLYFDTQSGLLLRDVILNDTMIGFIPEQLDFEDYRDVEGVKFPFSVRMSQVDPWVGWTRKFTEMHFNVQVDASKFDMPAAK